MELSLLKLLQGVCHGALNAGRGSGEGWFKKWTVGGKTIVKPLQLFAMAFTIFSAAFIGHSWIFATTLAIVSVLPMILYYDGTGGMMQAHHKQEINNPKEWPPLDWVCHWIAAKILKVEWKDISEPFPGGEQIRHQYCRLWGFLYASGIAIIFMIPFALTNPLYALALIFFPYACRYLLWRLVEFLFLSVYITSLLYSL